MTSLCKEEIIECSIETNHQHSDSEMMENDHLEESQDSDSLNDETFEETSEEKSTNEDIQMPIVNEINSFTTSCKEEIIESNSSETNPKIFLCYICNKEYKIYFHLKQHIRNVHEKKIIYNCDDCGKSFHKLDDLNDHINTIHNDQECEKYENDNNKSLSKTSNLKMHTIAINKDHKCKTCGKSDNFKLHIHTVHEDKNYKCQSCGKSFSSTGNLKNHILTVHEGHRDYKCESCGKSFSSSSYLKKHTTTIHEGHKYFKCDSCGKSFSQGQNLKRHKNNVHKGNKNETKSQVSNDKNTKVPEPHECKPEAEDEAEKTDHPFNSVDVKCENIQEKSSDIIIGTIFDCNLCDKSYNQKHGLIHHINIVHKGLKEFFCQLCADKFYFQRVRHDDLKIHIKNVHEGQKK